METFERDIFVNAIRYRKSVENRTVEEIILDYPALTEDEKTEILNKIAELEQPIIPVEPSLDQIKGNKINFLTLEYKNRLEFGFESDPKETGTPILFGYDSTDQKRLSGLLTAIAVGISPEIIQYKGKGEVPYDNYTIDEFKIIGRDALVHESTLAYMLSELVRQVKECVDKVGVDAVAW